MIEHRAASTGLWATVRADLLSTVDEKEIPPDRFLVHVLGKIVLNPRVRAVVLFRLAHYLAERHLLGPALLLRGRALRSSGAELHPSATIGPGLCLVHSSGVVVGGGTTIGIDCRLHQGATLGESGRGNTRPAGEPTIGDHVTIGAHAVVLGPIRVGNHAVIAANAVVVRDVPDGAVVGGIPAQVIRVVPSA